MEHTKELLSVPLASLVPSRFNVRRHSVGQVEELAALIEAQGLLHNLVVTEQEVGRGKSRKLKFAVAAGERRRRAMLLLQQRGRLPKEHEVLCELVPPERALEVSLAENSGREAMHPADEFEAFKALVDEGKGIEDVAVAFGVSLLTVQRRLKLAGIRAISNIVDATNYAMLELGEPLHAFDYDRVRGRSITVRRAAPASRAPASRPRSPRSSPHSGVSSVLAGESPR